MPVCYTKQPKDDIMDVILEPVQENDFSALIDLFQEFATFQKCPDAMTNSLERMIEDKDYFNCFVAKNADGDILAYATFFFAHYTWTGKALYMDDLYVREDNRNQGLGTKLINRVISYAMEQKCTKLRWQVSTWNEPAIEFYESLGAKINRTEINCELGL